MFVPLETKNVGLWCYLLSVGGGDGGSGGGVYPKDHAVVIVSFIVSKGG